VVTGEKTRDVSNVKRCTACATTGVVVATERVRCSLQPTPPRVSPRARTRTRVALRSRRRQQGRRPGVGAQGSAPQGKRVLCVVTRHGLVCAPAPAPSSCVPGPRPRLHPVLSPQHSRRESSPQGAQGRWQAHLGGCAGRQRRTCCLCGIISLVAAVASIGSRCQRGRRRHGSALARHRPVSFSMSNFCKERPSRTDACETGPWPSLLLGPRLRRRGCCP
jgi:hypothetical protein